MGTIEQNAPSEKNGELESIARIVELTKSMLCLNGTPVTHKKTGNLYYELCDVTNCTNSQDGQYMKLYMNADKRLFVRDAQEFHEKFEPKAGC